MNSIILERALVGKCALIAEIGVNYFDIAHRDGITPMEAAKKMITEAAASGIHAVKFQSYKADTLAARNSPYYWDIREEPIESQYELFRKFDAFGEAEYRELSEFCQEVDIEFCSTAFDYDSADYLFDLMNVYKISSSDLNNIPFIEYQASKGKPLLMSVGASNADEIDRAIAAIRAHSQQPIVVLHCVLEYPTPYEHASLRKISSLKERYPDLLIGYSDHTKPDPTYEVLKTAYTLGAVVIEKHFTLDKTLSGNDHYHAMDPSDAVKINLALTFLDRITGSGEIVCLPSESIARQNARRSVVAKGNIGKHEEITADRLTYKRPGSGISPTEVRTIIGKRAKTDILDDTILTLEMLE